MQFFYSPRQGKIKKFECLFKPFSPFKIILCKTFNNIKRQLVDLVDFCCTDLLFPLGCCAYITIIHLQKKKTEYLVKDVKIR